MKTPKKPTDPVTLGIGQGFRWLASLNPLKPQLFASASIGKNSGSFSDDNWNSLEGFAAEFSPDKNAVIVLQRTEEDGSKTLMGMICRDGEWMQAPANLLLEVNQISPELKTRLATPNLRCTDITSVYPDCPATDLKKDKLQVNKEDEQKSEEDHNPIYDAIPKNAVTHSPTTDAQIAERGRISAEIDDMFNWLSTLDAAKDHLYCGICTPYTKQTYFKENWNDIFQADCSASSADIVLEKEETRPDGTKKSTLMGLTHYGDKWMPLSQKEIEKLGRRHPEVFDWVANVQNPTYANIKDIYPSCPIPDEMPAAEIEAAVASEKTKKTKGRSGVAHEIERIFSWLATLDAVHGDLFCTAEVGRKKGFFWSANWHELLHFNPGAGDTATFVLLKREKTENGGKRDLLMGMKYGGKSWEVMTEKDLHELADKNTSLGHFIKTAANAMCINVTDIYPSCPV